MMCDEIARDRKYRVVRTLVQVAYQFLVGVRGLRQSGSSCSSSMWFPLCKVCTGRMTRVCRTVCTQIRDNDRRCERGITNLGEPSNSCDNISRFVHHDDGTSAETRLSILQRVEIHPIGSVRRVRKR